MTHSEQIVIFGLAAVAVFIWAMNIWGGWAEMFYEKYKNSSAAWYLLRVMGIRKSPENCIRFTKIISASGIVLVSVGLLISYLGMGRG